MAIETEKIRITAIIAVYNGDTHIEDTIKSVLDQQVPMDLIIIDGESTDKTLEIIHRYESRLYNFVSEPDKGIYDAFNKGWNMAHPDSFILYLGVGDKLITLPAMDSLKKADIVYGNVILNETGLFRSKTGFGLKLGNTLHHQALLVRKALHPISPFDTQYRLYADFDFNQRLYKREVRILADDRFLSYALPGGVTAHFDRQESLKIIRKNFGRLYFFLAGIYYRIQGLKGFLLGRNT